MSGAVSRGRRPKPLDDGATYVRRCVEMAGVGGVEPPHTAPETAVLPLDDTPSTSRCRTQGEPVVQARESILRKSSVEVNR